MLKKDYFIRLNTIELREKLKALGCDICTCCTFDNAVWLSTCNFHNSVSIHGVGYWDETCPFDNVDDAIAFFLLDTNAVDCVNDEELFLTKVKELINNKD